MGALFGGGGSSPPAGSGTSGTPSNQFAQYYQPQGQPGADQQYQNLLNTLYGQYSSGNTPSDFYGGQARNQSEAAFNLINGPQSFAGAIPGTVAGNPYAQEGIDAAQYLAENVAPEITGAIPGILQGSSALNAAGLDQIGLAPGLAAAGQAGYGQLSGLAPQLIASGFDPQSALYNSELDKITQQASASNAASGVTGPYAASTINDATGNFETNWQSQLLNRQLAGAQGAVGAQTGALQQLLQGSQGAGQALATGGGALAGSANLAGGIAPLSAGALGLKQAPGQAYLGQQDAVTRALSNYLTQVGQSQGATTGGFNIGQGGYALPESLLSGLGNYLKLGQNASLGSGSLGETGVQQATQGLQGLTGLGVLGTNALFGQNSPFAFGGGAGGGILGGLGGFGGGAQDFSGGISGAGDVINASGTTDVAGGSGALGWLGSLFGDTAAVV
jgi:hypothetical protein